MTEPEPSGTRTVGMKEIDRGNYRARQSFDATARRLYYEGVITTQTPRLARPRGQTGEDAR